MGIDERHSGQVLGTKRAKERGVSGVSKGIKLANGRYRYDSLKESDIQRTILDYLKAKRIMHHRQNVGCQKIGSRFIRFGLSGLPDIAAVIKVKNVGVACGFEVKSLHGDQSRTQREYQVSIESQGGFYFLVRGIEEVEKAIAEVHVKTLQRMREAVQDHTPQNKQVLQSVVHGKIIRRENVR